MQHRCRVCNTWWDENDMHNEDYCAQCYLDRFLGEAEIEEVPVQVFAYQNKIQFLALLEHVPLGKMPALQQAMGELLLEFQKENDTVICKCCDKPVSFKEAIFVTLNGQMTTICDYECYLKLEKGEMKC